MKRILIKDDDEDLFNVPLQPILYYYYKENLKEIRRMVKQQPLHTFPIYSRFVSSVVLLYQRWKHAPRVRARTSPAKWDPPPYWSQQNGRSPSAYDSYLHDRWGSKLYKMVHVDKELMKFFKEEDVCNNTSSSKSQNKTVNTCTRRPRRNRKRGHRNRNKNGGVRRPSGTQSEAVLVNERRETESVCAKEAISSVDYRIAGNKSNVQTKHQSDDISQKQRCKKETVPAAATFRYDKLFKFSNRNMNDEPVGSTDSNTKVDDSPKSSGTKEARTRKDATFRYDKLLNFRRKSCVNVNPESDILNTSTGKNKQKEKMSVPADKELTTNTDETTKTTDSYFFRYDRLFTFRTKKHTDHNDSDVGANGGVDCTDAETKQKKRNVLPSKEKESASPHNKTSDFFRYDRLFNFSKKKDKVQNGHPDENDELDVNTKEHNAKKKGNLHHPKEKEFTTNRGTRGKTENDFFRYDRLFNFSTMKQNVPDTDEVYISVSSSDDSYEYDSDPTYGPDYEYGGCTGFTRGPFQHAYHKRKMSQPVREINCNILEKYVGMYEACERCVAAGVQTPKVYCGQHCRRTHWHKQHHADHY